MGEVRLEIGDNRVITQGINSLHVIGRSTATKHLTHNYKMRLLHFVRNDGSSFCKLFIDPINNFNPTSSIAYLHSKLFRASD